MTAAGPPPRFLPPPPPPPTRSMFRFRAPRRTVRLRLTLLYVGLFLASAACLLVITYFLVAQQLPATLTVRTGGGGGGGGGGGQGWGSGWPSSARSRPRTAPNCAR